MTIKTNKQTSFYSFASVGSDDGWTCLMCTNWAFEWREKQEEEEEKNVAIR